MSDCYFYNVDGYYEKTECNRAPVFQPPEIEEFANNMIPNSQAGAILASRVAFANELKEALSKSHSECDIKVAKIQAEADKNIAKVRAEAAESISKVRAEAANTIAKIRAKSTNPSQQPTKRI